MPLIAPMLSLLLNTALAGWLSFGYVQAPGPGEQPALLVTPKRAIAEIQVVVEAGERSWKFTRNDLPANQQARFPWQRDTTVTTANCRILVEFADGSEEEYEIPITYTYAGGLAVKLDTASADVARKLLSVEVTERVLRAEVVATGAHGVELDRREVQLGTGPGRIELPWVGRPADVVLLDIKLIGERSWVTFTYSPWFLAIPHEDVLFASNEAEILPKEVPKLEDTLRQLREVLDTYGDVVPVKLYIAGCTDTVGSTAHNLELSRRRAGAIASWLRSHGYDKPIFYHGFGEGLLAQKTSDNTDNAANRRALYVVSVRPPGEGSGVPAVQWTTR